MGPPPPLLLLLLGWPLACHSACYFSIELQGQFLMQSAVAQGAGAGAGAASAVRYSQVNITPDAIPIWGHCHRRLGRNVILMDSSGSNKCIRCFHLNLRSANVLQVHTEGLDKCYISEQAAEASCPDEAQPHLGRPASEIILYKTREPGGAQARPQYCPISGRFSFTSRGSGGSGSGSGAALGGGGGLGLGPRRDCPLTEMSEMDSCPLGSALNLRYRNCNFPDFDVTYTCLGHWEGPAGQRYLALLNRDVDSYARYPRYRCALYAEDPATGAVSMAFSSDSTCRSDLRNASWGYEALQLTASAAPAWPERVEQSACRLPAWAQGHWQQLAVAGRSLVYHDHATFKTYTARCLWADARAERFLVFARTQCGEQMYTCLWLKQRSANVLELQMGLRTSSDGSPGLCEDSYFKPDTWITQGRLDRARETPCPVSGEHTGRIPDAQGLCARLASDCRSPERMYYAVSECSQAEVYEEREYRCLGQWEEGGFTYTYTQRVDVGTYECFVGSIVSPEEIYIKEAGSHCQRDVSPLQKGMKLTRQGPCATGAPPRSRTTSPWLSSERMPEPTKPWKPVTAPPRRPVESSAGCRPCAGSGPGLLLAAVVLVATWCCRHT